MTTNEAKKHVDAGNIAAAIAWLEQQSDAAAAVKMYEDLIQHAYWQKRDMKAVCDISHAGLDRVRRESEKLPAESATELKLRAKVIAYNLASFCRPGWGEPDIAIGDEEIRIGLEAARRHTALIQELELGPDALARTAWINGALLLSMKDFAGAQVKFEESASFAKSARRVADSLMAKGYALLTQLMADPTKESQLRAELDKVIEALKSEPDGRDYAQQIATAEREAIRK